MSEYWGLVVALCVGLVGGGGVVAWYKAKPENRVNDAEAWSKLVVNLQNEIARLAERVTTLEREQDAKNKLINDQEKRIEQLESEGEAKDAKISALEEKIRILEQKRMK